jgi:hypothetical protein
MMEVLAPAYAPARVVKPVGGAEAAERRLAALMLNLEHGCWAYGPNLEPLPGPHEPWPVVPLPPVTAQGVGVVAHYRPTVGLVYYTASDALRLPALLGRLAALLGGTEEHLKGYRAVAATPMTVLRHKGRVAGGTRVSRQRWPFSPPAPSGGLPARLLVCAPAVRDPAPPPHFSVRAAFTWLFVPVTAAFAIRGVGTMAAFNALVASLLYDAGQFARLADGADYASLAPGDFDLPALPPFLGAPAEGPGAAWWSPPAALAPVVAGSGRGVLIVAPAAWLAAEGLEWGETSQGPAPRDPSRLCLAYAGRPPCRCVRCGARRAQAAGGYAGLPWAPWDAAAVVARGPGQFQCCVCDAPVGGEAVLLRDPRAIAPGEPCHPGPGEGRAALAAPLLRATARGSGCLLLCRLCWASLEPAGCLARHMGRPPARVAVPCTQAEACAACPGYRGLAPLLGGAVEPVPGVAGAFAVAPAAGRGSKATSGPHRGAVVLVGESAGPVSALTVPALARLGLPVVSGLRLFEVRASLRRCGSATAPAEGSASATD